MNRNPATGDVSRLTGVDAVKQSMINLLLMNFYEKPFHPEIACALRSYLFDPMDDITTLSLKKAVLNCLATYEPRVEIIKVEIKPNYEQNAYTINITFNLLNTEKPEALTIYVERKR